MDLFNLGKTVKDGLETVRKTVDDFHTSEEEKMAAKERIMKVENDLNKDIIEAQAEIAKAKSEIIKTEAKGNWFKQWRPALMWSFILIILNNYILSPYIPYAKAIELPPDMWKIIIIGLGGYLADGIVGKASPHHNSRERD